MLLDIKIKKILNYLTLGNSFINKFVAPIGFSLSLFNFLKLYGLNLNLYSLIITLIIIIIIFYSAGLFYDKFGFYKFELEFNTRRNKYLIEKIEGKKNEK